MERPEVHLMQSTVVNIGRNSLDRLVVRARARIALGFLLVTDVVYKALKCKSVDKNCGKLTLRTRLNTGTLNSLDRL